MKSKAQEYADWKKRVVPDRPLLEKVASVTNEGNLFVIENTLTPTQALKLRDWLTDTFDTPVPRGLAKFELDLVEETEFPPTKY